ncbi:hypothetical protein [Cryptosporangium phraense]|uniref:Uncharacterized protein n=1 Tax=Cryptosporangium phraense TaxID=2593070 RepID=A0A545ASM9_9ACTN|nr:hypothetical protein [Cryptosporangium phraense]TQS44334.1 hypothetical protein FL583_15490 [Cryptosporangium phraense]
MMSHFLRWYWKPLLIGSALIAFGLYVPDSVATVLATSSSQVGTLRRFFVLFGVFAILVDPAALTLGAAWRRLVKARSAS